MLKLNGFGVSVLQRLCKTNIKKNLYYEIKDKVIEESFDGVRNIKKSAKVRVYGTDSSKEVRSRLIEILYDRVAMHKDKFIAPILHQEMESMEVKKNGKVEHSQNSHDDQVFSYLMALRVWYDGIDIMERYGIQKNTIKTDEDVDIELLSVDSSNTYGGMSPVDIDSMVSTMENNEENEVEDQLDYVKKAGLDKLYQDYYRQKHQDDYEVLQQLINTNSEARKAFAKKNHLDPEDRDLFDNQGGFINLPDELFGNTEVYDDEESSNDNIVGNLAAQWRNIFM